MYQVCIIFLLICSAVPLITATDIKLEAEDGTLSGVSVHTAIKPFSGRGYVTDFDKADDKIIFNVNIPNTNTSSPLYELKIQYNSPHGDKGVDLIINGHVTSGMLTANGNQFSLLSVGKFLLKQGSNNVVIGNGWGHFSIDFIVFVPGQQIQFNIRQTPINPHATIETKKLYTALIGQFGKKVLSGQHFERTEIEYIREQSGGKEPVVVAYDFMNTNYFGNQAEQTANMQHAIDWSKNKDGVVSFSWHWRNPLGIPHNWTTLGFYVDKNKDDVHVDLNQLSNTNSEEYKAIVRDIDHVAIYLKQAQSANVPILFRPLHEAQGRWFWWGEQGPVQTKQLYHLLYNRLMHYHRLDNLLWVWTTEAIPSAMNWYPGDDFVDILGVDIYEAKGQHNSYHLQFENVKDLFNGKKMIALSENGGLPDPDKLVKDDAHWSWFLTWCGEIILDESWNSKAFINNVYNHAHILTRGQFKV